MPVRFLCDHCGAKLSIGRRKIGTEIQCPKCRVRMVVPEAEAASANLAMSQSEPGEPEELFPEFSVFDDASAEGSSTESSVIPPPPAPPVSPPPPGKPPAANRSRPAAKQRDKKQPARENPAGKRPERERAEKKSPPQPPPDNSRRRKPAAEPPPASDSKISATPTGTAERLRHKPRRPRSDMLLISRRALFMQGALIFLVGAIGLAAGYFIGRGRGPLEGGGDPANVSVELIGTVTYIKPSGEQAKDEGAAVIVAPEGKLVRIPSGELGPLAAQPSPAALAAIENIGGAHGRADAHGEYLLKVPRPGRYHVLIISRHAQQAQPGIRPDDLKIIRRYFTNPAALIGRQQYHWATQDLEGKLAKRGHEFKP